MYDFDKVIDRTGTNCVKWDDVYEHGLTDVLPMWVADMDFEVSPYIIEEMQKVLDRKVFGYQYTTDEYEAAIVSWMKRRHHYDIEKDWICYTPNVVSGLCLAIMAVSEPGDEIIIQTPVYGPFYKSIRDNGRVIVENPLKNQDGYYTMDYEDFERKITPKTKAVILCNPHNPCGRVWTEEELKKLADICLKHDLYMISDDIHGDLVYKGHSHTVIAGLSEEIAERCIVYTAPSKTFNLAGMQIAHCIIKNKELRRRFRKPMKQMHLEGGNSFEEAMVIGAYKYSEQWLEELLVYLEGNVDYFVDFVKTRIPKLKVCKPEGTYLMWLDCREIQMDQDQLENFFIKECKLYINDGTFFGEKGRGFMRMNLACPRAFVKEGLERIEKAINKLEK